DALLLITARLARSSSKSRHSKFGGRRHRPEKCACKLPSPNRSLDMAIVEQHRLAGTTVAVNGRSYAFPMRPTVVLVIDGFDPAYLEHGVANGILPVMKSFREHGFMAIADCSMPSTTNTNNTSIVTGVPPAVHGINGNYYLDPETGKEIMITDASRLRCGTII